MVRCSSNQASLYIHVPFCRRKCPYCQFYSVSSEQRQEDYLNALMVELSLRHKLIKSKDIVSIYFGGGTPSLLRMPVLESVISWMRDNIPSYDSAEVTLEANPDDINADVVKEYIRLGINRMSLGVQSFDDVLLTPWN